MSEEYFGINYTFGKDAIDSTIDKWLQSDEKKYVCVADGVTLALSTENKALKNVLDEAGMVVCDSSWVPLYLRSLYGIKREQYAGSDFLMNAVTAKKYRLMFIGASEHTLDALKNNLARKNEGIREMTFLPLPFLDVTEFDYKQIAEEINRNRPDLIFVSLGMPKQEFFMHRLIPYINRGVLIGVGAAFKFHSGLANQKRAPQFMIKAKMEWIYRIWSEPEKQLKRCRLIFMSMPKIYWKEYRNKKNVAL
ncbi:hypothetical protein AGMMS50262_13710 [Bacteroidia bacterium]|nr:hypothetical protein AGMMS50262_13710 [Bacteroidia bacterium]